MGLSAKVLNGSLAVMGAVTLVNAGQRLHGRNASREPSIGDKLDFNVSGGQPAPVALSNVTKGYCTLVVVYSPTCGASAALAQQWRQDLSLSSKPLPENWRAVWVSSLDSLRSSSFDVPGKPVLSRYSSGNIAMVLGVKSYPFHFVLDRSGRLVSKGRGAPLEPIDSYNVDCRIAHKPTSE